MKKYILPFLLLFCGNLLFGQAGISVAYKNFKANDWFDLFKESNNVQTNNVSGFNAGIGYWFRLKNKRIEFLPELSFEQFKVNFGTERFENQAVNFHFNTNFYFLDFSSDCDCPTFSKQGNFFTKGFFVQISPGISFMKNEFRGETEKIENDLVTFSLGAGVGVDIGISKLITITPMVKYYFLSNVEWEGLGSFYKLEKENVSADVNLLYAGVRVGIRWKE